MYSQRQKVLYPKYSPKPSYQSTNDPQGVQAMKKSIDSLYKQLNTPHDETEEKINESETDQTNGNKDTISTRQITTNYRHKQNLTSRLNQCTSFSKQSTDSQFGQKPSNKKILKPSTPTFHAQSSLNFLKNRKQQIIMNQAIGLTYDNIQILRKTVSKSRLGKSSNKSSVPNSISTPQDSNTNSYLNKLNHLKKVNDIRRDRKFEKVRSVSQLSKIESILDANDESSSKRSFLQRSRIKNTNFLSRAKSQTNSLRSSRAFSSSSQSSKSSTSREIRANLISSISSKIDYSKLLKDIEATKQKKIIKQTKKSQDKLQKRLQNLQNILFEIQKKDKINRQKSEITSKTTNKKISNSDFMTKIKQQIDNLTNELLELQRSSKKPCSNGANKNDQFRNVPVINSANKMIYRQISQRTEEYNISSRINNNVFMNPGALSSTIIHRPKQDRSKSQTKITFNYKNIQNGPYANGQLRNSTQNRFNNVFPETKPPSYSSINYGTHSTCYQAHSYQDRTLTPSFDHFQSHQYPPYQQPNQLDSIPRHFQHQNPRIPNQLHIVPQLSYPQNKTISLKNKHAIEAKRQSPLKVNHFHFMANNLNKNTFH